MTSRDGLTRIELAIAVVIVGLVASAAVPAAMNRRILANEASAMAALRDIATAQERFKAAHACDVDGDGVAEFGLIRELTGRVGVRTTPNATEVRGRLVPPLLPSSFRRFVDGDDIARSGYLFRVFMPAYLGGAAGDVSTGNLDVAIETDRAETTWCCYAWPQRHGVTGGRTFFINQAGDITSTDAKYSGRGAFSRHLKRGQWPSHAGAAFATGVDPDDITGDVAVGTLGRDGNLWQLASPHVDARDLVARGAVYGGDIHVVRYATFEIASHEGPTGTRETFVVRAFNLKPGRRYNISVDAPHVGLGRDVTADADCRAVFRFDSRRDVYPADLASLTQLVGGRVSVEATNENDFFGASGTIPRFNVRSDTTPVPETIDADEASAIAALRQIAVAQEQFKAMDATRWTDVGGAQYGLLRELTGMIGVRTTNNASTVGAVVNPPLLPSSFTTFASDTEVARSGYLLHQFLPSVGGLAVSDIAYGSVAANIDSELAATTWCCYASPVRYGRTGKRTFFIDQTGDVVATDVKAYSGTGAFEMSNAGAAFRAIGNTMSITGSVATGTVGRDGNLWRAVPSRPDEHDFVVRGAMTSAGAAAGTFVVESRQLMTATNETIDVDAIGLDASKDYRVVLTDASQSTHVLGTTTSDARGGVSFRFDGRFHSLPDGVASVVEFGGGTIELRDGDASVLAGAVPVFTTVLGPTVAGSTAVFHLKKPLDDLPKSLPRAGSLDVRVTNAEDDRRGRLVVDITTFDRGATYDVVAVEGQDVETALGAVRVVGWRGVGALSLDTDAAAVVALSGARIEVRSSTGAVVLAGTMPVVK